MAEPSSTSNPVKDEEAPAIAEKESTVEPEPTSSGYSSWFSNIVNVAKQKSSKTLEFMKKDLTEFKDTVQQGTTAALSTVQQGTTAALSTVQQGTSVALSTTTNYIGETITSLNNMKDEFELQGGESIEPEPEQEIESSNEQKELIPSPKHSSTNSKEQDVIDYLSRKAKSIFSSIVDVMIPHEYDDDDDICFVKENKIVSIERGRWDLLIKTIQSDPQTYCHEPEGPPEDYENWLASFNLIDHDYKVQQLLSAEGDVKSFYDKLVPHSITPDEFWHRYFYKVHQLKQIEFQRLAAKAEEQDKLAQKESEENEKEPKKAKIRSSPEKKASPSGELDEKSTAAMTTTTVSTTSSSVHPTASQVSGDDANRSGASVAGKVNFGGDSPDSASSAKQSDGSEEWVKAEMMDDIVVEAMKKLDTKLTDSPSSKTNIEEDDIYYDWDSS